MIDIVYSQLPEVKNFIFGDFESKFERTVFKKIPGKAPEAIFYTASNKEVEKLNIEKFTRYTYIYNPLKLCHLKAPKIFKFVKITLIHLL